MGIKLKVRIMETLGKEEATGLSGSLCWERGRRKNQKNERKGLSPCKRDSERNSAFKNNRVRECNQRDQSQSQGPNVGSQSTNSGQDDISNSGSVSLASSGILPAALSEEIGFPDFLNEPSCWAGNQHT